MASSTGLEEQVFATNARFYQEISRWRLDEQIGRIESLDRKLIGTFTLNGVLIALVSAALGFRGDVLPEASWWAFLLVVLIFVLNVLASFFAFRIRQWRVLPTLADLEDTVSTGRTAELYWWTAQEMKRAFLLNEQALGAKARWLRLATLLTMSDLALAAVAAVLAAAPW